MKTKSVTIIEPSVTLTFGGIENQAEVEFVDDPTEPGWSDWLGDNEQDNKWPENVESENSSK